MESVISTGSSGQSWPGTDPGNASVAGRAKGNGEPREQIDGLVCVDAENEGLKEAVGIVEKGEW
jgi:hypothetical protein